MRSHSNLSPPPTTTAKGQVYLHHSHHCKHHSFWRKKETHKVFYLLGDSKKDRALHIIKNHKNIDLSLFLFLRPEKFFLPPLSFSCFHLELPESLPKQKKHIYFFKRAPALELTGFEVQGVPTFQVIDVGVAPVRPACCSSSESSSDQSSGGKGFQSL